MRGRTFRLIGAALVAAALAGCSEPPPPIETDAAGLDVAGAAQGVGGGSFTNGEGISGYRLGPGDQLRLTVFGHEDLSGEFQLDPAGGFTMPLVGELDALAITTTRLEQRIETALSEGGYLVDPQVSIEVLNFRPFYVIGEVNNPGSYAYASGLTVTSAVSLAGGLTFRANGDEITITRGGANADPSAATADAEVLPGDIIEVPERFF